MIARGMGGRAMRKLSEHSQQLGLSMRWEADKHSAKAIFYASILVFAHLLDIKPSNFETAGLKISIPDPSILYGSISLIFFHYLFNAVFYGIYTESLSPLSLNRKLAQHFAYKARLNRKLTTPKARKADAVAGIIGVNIFMSPYYTFVIVILIFAVLAATYDVILLLSYLWDNSSMLKDFAAFVAGNESSNPS